MRSPSQNYAVEKVPLPAFITTAHFTTSKIAVFAPENEALGGYEMASSGSRRSLDADKNGLAEDILCDADRDEVRLLKAENENLHNTQLQS